MAGPIVQLRATNYTRAEQVKIKTLLSRIAIMHEEKETEIEFCFKKGKTLGLYSKENSCTFLMHTNNKEEYDEDEKENVEIKLNDNPAQFISIYAMCNRKDDHYLLASFALEINKIVGGFINLKGAIIPPLLKDEKGNFIQHTRLDEEIYVNAIKGAIYEIGYKISDTRNYYYHIVDRTWLINWMEHDDFRMIK
jgi:Family of unknown function (DUF6368)